MTDFSATPVIIYTDGSCLGNPGPGGWACILIWKETRRELSGGFAMTTNNRMELAAALQALRALRKPCRVELHTDSRYLHDALEKGWLPRWKKNGWKTADKKNVKNRDLWVELDRLTERHEVNFHWVRGHSSHPENERCDQLAKAAASEPDLPPDPGFEPSTD